MDRRNFLAIIPALSAIPIIGQHVEKEKDKIIIYPEGSIPGTIKDNESFTIEFQVAVYHKGKLFATGFPKEMEFITRTSKSPWKDFSMTAELFKVNDEPF